MLILALLIDRRQATGYTMLSRNDMFRPEPFFLSLPNICFIKCSIIWTERKQLLDRMCQDNSDINQKDFLSKCFSCTVCDREFLFQRHSGCFNISVCRIKSNNSDPRSFHSTLIMTAKWTRHYTCFQIISAFLHTNCKMWKFLHKACTNDPATFKSSLNSMITMCITDKTVGFAKEIYEIREKSAAVDVNNSYIFSWIS